MVCVCLYESGKVRELCGSHYQAMRILQKPLEEKLEAAECEIVRLRDLIVKIDKDTVIFPTKPF